MEQDQSKVLLVEGTGDEGVIREILDAWDVPCPSIKACGSDVQVFQALKLYLSNPAQYKTIGVVVDAARVGLWIMPDNQGHGMLEDFLSGMAAAVHPELLEESEHAISKVESQGIQQYTSRHRPKAKIHTYLAWQEEPGRTLPQAIQKHYLDVSSENARPFVTWLNRLFWE